MSISSWLMNRVIDWLNRDIYEHDIAPLTGFERLCEEIRQGDVLLVEGRSRISNVIKAITNSAWTHSALYIGRLEDIKDTELRDKIFQLCKGDPRGQLIIEAMLGEGTVVRPINQYQDENLRICRPKGLSRDDRQKVIAFAVTQLGYEYDVRHLLDLARFLLPYSFFPKRWQSTLFQKNAGYTTRNICSYMMAEAFTSVDFPILPIATRNQDGTLTLHRRNPRLFTPRDFDYSPYFDIIKYPYFGLDDVAAYRQLPWDSEGIVCNTDGDCFVSESAKKSKD